MKKPNIVFILNDHQAYYRRGWDGGVKPKRPNFEKLAESGIEFTNAYCGTPLCGPVRRSIVNGLYAHTHKNYYNNSEIPCDEESYLRLLTQNGYNNYYYGKWHAGVKTPITDHLCEGFSMENYGNPYISEEYKEYLEKRGLTKAVHKVEYEFNPKNMEDQGMFKKLQVGAEYSSEDYWCGEHAAGITITPKETHESFFLANLACDKLEELSKKQDDKPFSLRVDFWGPHQPFFPTKEFADMYNPEEIEVYGNHFDTLEGRADVHRKDTNKGLCNENEEIILPSQLKWNHWQVVLARAYAHQTMIDAAGGQIINKLKELGLDKNTIIIWTTDHGDSIASHGGHFDKCSYMSQEVMRIPMAISWPGEIEKGQKSDKLVSNLDVPSTILDAAGLEFSGKVDSRSLLSMIKDDSHWPEDIMCETYGHGYTERIKGRMYVKRDYKYVTFENQIDELYNLKNDPYELNNLAYKKEYSDVLETMKKGLLKLQKESSDTDIF